MKYFYRRHRLALERKADASKVRFELLVGKPGDKDFTFIKIQIGDRHTSFRCTPRRLVVWTREAGKVGFGKKYVVGLHLAQFAFAVELNENGNGVHAPSPRHRQVNILRHG